jgi:hypothetical protein
MKDSLVARDWHAPNTTNEGNGNGFVFNTLIFQLKFNEVTSFKNFLFFFPSSYNATFLTFLHHNNVV